MSTKYYKNTPNEMIQKKALKSYQNISEDEIKRKHQYAWEQFRNLFIVDNGPSEEEKSESINMLANDIEIILKKRKTKSVNMLANDMEIFRKKKNAKSVNILANVIEIFL